MIIAAMLMTKVVVRKLRPFDSLSTEMACSRVSLPPD
jgi:hypothetical protein